MFMKIAKAVIIVAGIYYAFIGGMFLTEIIMSIYLIRFGEAYGFMMILGTIFTIFIIILAALIIMGASNFIRKDKHSKREMF